MAERAPKTEREVWAPFKPIKKMKNKIKKNLSLVIATMAYVLFLVACILFYAIDYITNVIQVESFSQFLYTMQVGFGGASNTVWQILEGFALSYLLWILSATFLYLLFFHAARKEKRYRQQGREPYCSKHTIVTLNSTVLVAAAISMGLVVCQIREGYQALKIGPYLEEQNIVSTLYEDNYVMTNSSLLSFPSQKKNLIYIYMESMETTFASHQQGGGFDTSLIPNLYQLAMDNENFQGSLTTLNGGQVTNNTSWTVAGMTAQTSATPLGVSNSKYNHSFDEETLFLPAIQTLGDVLEQEGYQNVLMCGSQASYAGRANYFRQHGNYQIFDLDAAHESGALPKNYHEWWGFEDAKLIDFAKEALLDLANQNQPFNFTMLTADTHFKDGYLCPDCEDEFDAQYENVIHCSDKRIAQFVAWIQEQDFYNDTVIVLSGDHLSMDSLINQSVGLDFPRKTYFCIINGPTPLQNSNRQFTTLDIFPTTLEAMNIDVKGDRLGLGTSLYGARPTLIEEKGFDWLNTQIAHRSMRFEEEILKDDGLQPNGESLQNIPVDRR